MKHLVSAIMAMVSASAALADANRLCETARSAAVQFAAERGWQADVRCRGTAGPAIAAGAVLQPIDPPRGMALRSGPATWSVRVQAPGAAAYVQRVPLSIAWTAPAWVSRRDMAAGATLRDGDVDLQARRWPDGVAVDDAPLAGRLRRALRAGDIVTGAHLLPADTLVRGDSVTAVLAEGAVEIRMPAQLLAPARVGERARVQVTGRPAALEGLLADAQTVKVGP